MPLKERQAVMEQIEKARPGRVLVCFFTFDRESIPLIGGLMLNFASDTKEPLFRVLKESLKKGDKIDLCLYTRGGDTNAVWPIASLLREFDPDFNVLVPFRCHSAGTLLALGSKRIIMSTLAELSPIDPSTGNQFNPVDPNAQQNRLAISVEDVQQYRNFVLNQLEARDEKAKDKAILLNPFLAVLTEKVHPLALGNVHRVHLQIQQLARNLLELHPVQDRKLEAIIESLTTRFYSHLHMISRHEAREILGEQQVEFADEKLSGLLDDLLRTYEGDFYLRRPFVLAAHFKDEPEKADRFISGAIESKSWSYLYETNASIRRQSQLPPNVQVQLPPGQPMPLIPGLPVQYNIDIVSQGWVHNREPKGITTE
jgi:ATP-dependent protease ClpP protease subunit